MTDLEAATQTFFTEAKDLLEAMESALLRDLDELTDSETLNEIFRAAHTIKGSAGLFNMATIVGFTHVVENVLDRARGQEIIIDQDLQGLLLTCRDHIGDLVEDAADGCESSEQTLAHGEELLSKLFPYLGEAAAEENAEEPAQSEQEKDSEAEGPWHISLRLNPDVLRDGMDPMSFIRYLSGMGELRQIATLEERLPDTVDEFDPETLYLGFELDVETKASREEIQEVFDFVKIGSEITILPPSSKVSEYIELIRSMPESEQRLGVILVRSGAITQRELEEALDQQTVQSMENQDIAMLGEILAKEKSVAPQLVEAALDKQKKFSEKRQDRQVVRVDAEKLDILINLIGELVISHQRVDLLATKTGHSQLLDAVNELGGFTEYIRDAALTLRMVPIGDIFQRFRRVVRDTAAELNKKIELKIRGAETELDRSMVEKLSDPLTHIVRNAIDHGIESPEHRLKIGKPEVGTVLLSAYHDSGIIVIEITDDGAGLNVEKIREKAIVKGVLDANATISDTELKQLVFHPGLSTASEVTNLSGRGVGMDVVKKNIDALQGSADVDSSPGKGTRLRIRLPLTLAIIDGFHVVCRNTHFIVPQNTVLECINLSVLKRDQGRNCVNLRGDQIPTIRLSEVYNIPAPVNELEELREELVVVQFGDNRAGVIVEGLFGEVQTVVKPLSPLFQSLQGIGGSSLLGSGDIAFILDIPQLIELAKKREYKAGDNVHPPMTIER